MNVFYGKSDTDWAELLKFREELKQKEDQKKRILSDVNESLMMRLTYDVCVITHDCYKTGKYVPKIKKTIYVKTVPLPNIFIDCDIIVHGNQRTYIPIKNDLLQSLYNMQDEIDISHGEANRSTTKYVIKSATVINCTKRCTFNV